MAGCRKRKYSKKGAEMALLDMRIRRQLRGNPRRREQRIYYHSQCKAWHVTSKGKENVGQTQVQEKPLGQSPMDETYPRTPSRMGRDDKQERESEKSPPYGEDSSPTLPLLRGAQVMGIRPPSVNWIWVTCPTCKGEERKGRSKCPLCKGKKKIKVPREPGDK